MTTMRTLARKNADADARNAKAQANAAMRVQAADVYADALKQLEGLDICLAGTLHKEAAAHADAAATRLKSLAGVLRALHDNQDARP